MMYFLAIFLIFLGTIFSGFGGRWLGGRGAGILTAFFLFIVFFFALFIFYQEIEIWYSFFNRHSRWNFIVNHSDLARICLDRYCHDDLYSADLFDHRYRLDWKWTDVDFRDISDLNKACSYESFITRQLENDNEISDFKEIDIELLEWGNKTWRSIT